MTILINNRLLKPALLGGSTSQGGGGVDPVIGTGTTAEMLLSSPNFGDEWLNTTYNKKFFYNGTIWLVLGEMAEYTNTSGRALVEGEFVILDSSTAGVRTVAALDVTACAGVVVLGGANNAPVGVAYAGRDWRCLVGDTVFIGDYLRSSTVNGRWSFSTFMTSARFMQSLESGFSGSLLKARFLVGENT